MRQAPSASSSSTAPAPSTPSIAAPVNQCVEDDVVLSAVAPDDPIDTTGLQEADMSSLTAVRDQDLMFLGSIVKESFRKYDFSICLGFLVVVEGPGLFRQVREAPGIHFHQVSSKSELHCPSYDPKTEKMNDKQSNDY